jgi:hypothetical protein
MLILYSIIYTLPILKKICKINKIKNYSKLNKIDILEILNKHKSASYIQKNLRNKLMPSELCPITFDLLQYPFISIKNNKIFRYYSLDGLINYYNVSKDYRDPFTKENISTHKINEINSLAKFYKKKQILLPSRRSVNSQRRTELLTILCCINDVVNNIMSTTQLTSDYIYNYAVPQLMTYVYYLIIRCRIQTRSILQHFIDIIERHVDINKYYIINYLVCIMINENL